MTLGRVSERLSRECDKSPIEKQTAHDNSIAKRRKTNLLSRGAALPAGHYRGLSARQDYEVYRLEQDGESKGNELRGSSGLCVGPIIMESRLWCSCCRIGREATAQYHHYKHKWFSYEETLVWMTRIEWESNTELMKLMTCHGKYKEQKRSSVYSSPSI